MGLFGAWQAYQRIFLPRLAPSTQTGYRSAVKLALASLPDEPSAADVERWYQSTLSELCAPTYASAVLKICRIITAAAARHTGDDATAEAFRLVRPRRGVRASPRVPPADALERARKACRNKAELAFLGLAALAGLRRGELMGLQPGDYDQATGVLTVTRQRERRTRKNGGAHTVLVTDKATRAALEWTLAHHDDIRPRQGWHKGKSVGYVFPWADKYVDLFWGRVRAAVGDDVARYFPRGWAWHCLRSWGATAKARDGADVWEVCGWLGDSDPKVASMYVALGKGAATMVAANNRAEAKRPAKRVDKSGRAQCSSTAPSLSTSFGEAGVVPHFVWKTK